GRAASHRAVRSRSMDRCPPPRALPKLCPEPVPMRKPKIGRTMRFAFGAGPSAPWCGSARAPRVERRSVLVAVVALERQARLAVEEDLLGVPRAEIEHVGDRAGELVERPVADATEAPVVLDESDHRRLIDQGVVDEIHAAP